MGLRPSRPLRGRQTRCLRQPYRCRVSGHSPAHPACSFLVLPRPSGQLMLLEHQRAWALDRWTQKVRLPDLRLAISNGHGLALRPECLPHSFQPRQQTGSSRPAERLSGEGCWVEALSAPAMGPRANPLAWRPGPPAGSDPPRWAVEGAVCGRDVLWSSLLRGGYAKVLQGVRSPGPQLVLEAVRGAPSPGPPDAPRAGQGWGGQDPARLQSSQVLGVLDSPAPLPSLLGGRLISRRILCRRTSLSPAGSCKID